MRAALHAAVGAVSVGIAKGNIAANGLAAGVNELVVQELGKRKDTDGVKYYDKHPEELQWISATLGSAISSVAGGNATAGASTAASGTKNNELSKLQADYKNEIEQLIMNDKTIASDKKFKL